MDLDPNAPICAKVADFGLAKMMNPDVSGNLGTWQWLAPEVIDQSNKFYDERSDGSLPPPLPLLYNYIIIITRHNDYHFLDFMKISNYKERLTRRGKWMKQCTALG